MEKRHLSAVLREYDIKRMKNEQIMQERKNELFKKCPEIIKIDNKVRSNIAKSAIIAFDDNIKHDEEIEKLRENHRNLTREKKALLVANNYPKNYLDPVFECPMCKDYGYVELKVCDCVKKACEVLQYREKSAMWNVKTQSFDYFNFDVYSKEADERYKKSPYENMEINFKIAKDYADNFTKNSGNLLFCGSTGLSKTFLSTSIAKIVTEKSYSVVYDTCINLFNTYESVKFRNFDEVDSNISFKQAKIEQYTNCDLLIIDDLGTEMVTAFTISVLYDLINDRIMRNKPMIINTNFVLPEISKKYSPAIASRLDGDFRFVFFFGDDIRKQVKNN
ncbi:MAG: ATP-binding protein [Clostridia bacterium]